MLVRVKRIPNPVVRINGIGGGGISAATFRIQIAPAAILENFEFNARFQVVGFSFSMQPKGRDYVGPYIVNNPNGARFTDNPQIQAAMKIAKAGDKIYVEEVRVKGPDGVVRKLDGSVNLNLN